MATFLWIILILVTLAVGAYIGHLLQQARGPRTEAQLHKDYLMGLNFLLNEQPDKAVDIFIKMLKVDKDTIETHIALGNLFRKRGEVDRALRIHQNLLERPNLDTQQKVNALFELGQDYLTAGVFDRAEDVFKQVVTLDGSHVIALKQLLNIYQQEKDWLSCVMVAKKLELATGQPMHQTIAHYYCEEAEKVYQSGDAKDAEKYLDEAVSFDKRCVRASLIRGRALLKAEDYQAALKQFKKIQSQNSEFLSEAASEISQCYQALNDAHRYEEYLKSVVLEVPNVPFMLLLSEVIRQKEGEQAAVDFVSEFLKSHASFSGLHVLLSLQLPLSEGQMKTDLDIMNTLVDRVIKGKPRYRCSHCGFAGKILHWQCIGCKRWGVMQPIHGVEFG